MSLHRRARTGLVAALFALYLVALGLIGFWPTPVDRGAYGVIDRVLAALHRRGAPAWFDYGFIESGANVLLFIPFGLAVALLLAPRVRWLALPAGIAASCLIETGQGIFLAARFATYQDVLANSLGAAVGMTLVYALTGRRAA